MIIVVLLMGLVAWAYRALRPPAPRLCGTKGGPSLVGPRVKLRDGRHMSYKEHGVPKEAANYKVILVHGFSSCKHEAPITATVLSCFRFLLRMEYYLFLLKLGCCNLQMISNRKWWKN